VENSADTGREWSRAGLWLSQGVGLEIRVHIKTYCKVAVSEVSDQESIEGKVKGEIQ
jgi:hypothetical protein